MKEEQSFTPGEMVEVINGPFTKATGKVRDVNNDKRMLVVVVKDGLSGIVVGDLPVELKFREASRAPL